MIYTSFLWSIFWTYFCLCLLKVDHDEVKTRCDHKHLKTAALHRVIVKPVKQGKLINKG